MKILLLLPPFYSPFTPPLGISILKSFLEKKGYQVKLLDFNINPEQWEMHHEYFNLIDRDNQLEGYSLYWYILNAHMLAYVNNASPEQCTEILNALFEKYSLIDNSQIVVSLVSKVENYFENLKIILKEIDVLAEYSFVGTSTFSTSLASSLYILKWVKEEYPSINTLMGGGVFADDLAIGTENLDTLINEYSYIDKIVIGEGENLLWRVIEGEFEGQKVVSLSDLDSKTLDINKSVIPDFSDLNIDFYQHLTIEGSRSCPFQCKFCSERIQWGSYRKKDAVYLADQLIRLKNTYDKDTFFLGDSLINFYIEDLANELMQHDDQVYFDGYLRAEPQVTDRELTKFLARVGLYRVRLGMESASPTVLKLMNKQITPDNMTEVLKSLSNAGIRTTTYWVVGYPGETEEDFMETYNFIKENHQYIYELEAHPYYYYPTGQGISDDFKYESIYPEWIGEIIKFKKYDIKDPIPSQEVRLRRLKRITDLCHNLGLINAYSLDEIYKAEERWFRLSPLAVEIYEDSKPVGKLPQLNQGDLELNLEVLNKQSVLNRVDIEVNEDLDINFLKQASNILQEKYQMLFTCKLEFISNSSGKELVRLIDNIDEIAIITNKIEENKYLVSLLGRSHRFDLYSLNLLAEGLYRIYRQMSENREVDLLPIEKNYTDFINEWKENSKVGQDYWQSYLAGEYKKNLMDEDSEGKTLNHCFKASIDLVLISKYGLEIEEFILFVIMRSISKIFGHDLVGLDISRDYRNINNEFEDTVGPLSFEFPYYYEMNNTINLHKSIRNFQADLKMVPVGGVNFANSSINNIKKNNLLKNQIAVDLTRLGKEAWLGGDSWELKEPIINNKMDEYLLEITPIRIKNDNLKIIFRFDKALVDQVKLLDQCISREIRLVLEFCQTYLESKQIWIKEFKDYSPSSSMLIESQRFKNKNYVRDRLDFTIERDLVNYLDKMAKAEKVGLSLIYLAAFQVLLAKFKDTEEVVSLFSDMDQVNIIPVRGYLSADKKFKYYLHELKDKVYSFKNKEYGIDILREYYSDNNKRNVFGVGFFIQRFYENLQLSMTVDGVSGAIIYLTEFFERETIRVMSRHFIDILKTISDNFEEKIDNFKLNIEKDKMDEEPNEVDIDVNFNF